MTTAPITTAIVGFGRSGCGIHADAMSAIPDRFRIAAVYDPLGERSAEATKFGGRAAATFDSILADPAIELVVVASPNGFHAPQALAALRAGKHVLCEKPFGFTTAEVDQLIAAARSSGKVLQAFQQRRFEPDFQRVRDLCASGIFGRLTTIRITWHGFSRRWDWQTSRACAGGQLYNNGPHLIDYAMELFGPSEPTVHCELRNALSSGDAEDEFRVTLSGTDAPTIQLELLATAAFPQDRWWICGTAGGLRGGAAGLEWKWVDWSTMPARPLDIRPTEGRSYNSEKLPWQTGSWTAASAADAGAGAPPARQPALDLYANLHQAIRSGGAQVIPPIATRRRIAVLEACYRQCGIPFPKAI